LIQGTNNNPTNPNKVENDDIESKLEQMEAEDHGYAQTEELQSAGKVG
jgi:hypothetical protein